MRLSTLARLLVATFAVAVVGGEGKGQLVTFDTATITSQSASLAATFNATQVASGVSGIPQLSRTTVTATGSGASGSFFSTGSNTTNTLNLATHYVGFQVAPATGQALIVRDINWTSQGSSTAPNSYATAYSTDNFSTATQTVFTGTTSTGTQARSFNVTDLITNDTLSVRLYNYGATSINNGASASGGSFRVITPTVIGSTVTAATGNISLVAATEIRNSGAMTLGGIVGGSFGIQKTGAGTLTFTNANTYSGNTAITQGSLVLSGTGSVNSSAAISVGSGATFDVTGVTGGYSLGSTAAQTLQGTGTVTGAVTVNSGSTIRGDSGTGTSELKTANVTVQAGGTLLVQLGTGTTASSLDTSASSGILNLNTNAILDLSGTLGAGSRTIATLATGTGKLVVGGTTYNSDAQIAQYVSPGGAGSQVTFGSLQLDLTGYTLTNGDTFTLSRTGNNLVLDFQPVPEPVTVLAIGAAGLGLASWVRRKRKAKAATA